MIFCKKTQKIKKCFIEKTAEQFEKSFSGYYYIPLLETVKFYQKKGAADLEICANFL